MECSIARDEGDLLVLCCQGDIQQADVWPTNPLEGYVGSQGFHRRVLLDLGGMTFIDSRGIGWLVMSQRRFAINGGKLVLYNIPALLRDMLRTLRLEQHLHIAPNEDEARALALKA